MPSKLFCFHIVLDFLKFVTFFYKCVLIRNKTAAKRHFSSTKSGFVCSCELTQSSMTVEELGLCVLPITGLVRFIAVTGVRAGKGGNSGRPAEENI